MLFDKLYFTQALSVHNMHQTVSHCYIGPAKFLETQYSIKHEGHFSRRFRETFSENQTQPKKKYRFKSLNFLNENFERNPKKNLDEFMKHSPVE